MKYCIFDCQTVSFTGAKPVSASDQNDFIYAEENRYFCLVWRDDLKCRLLRFMILCLTSLELTK
jgi:hypothetical protein